MPPKRVGERRRGVQTGVFPEGVCEFQPRVGLWHPGNKEAPLKTKRNPEGVVDPLASRNVERNPFRVAATLLKRSFSQGCQSPTLS